MNRFEELIMAYELEEAIGRTFEQICDDGEITPIELTTGDAELRKLTEDEFARLLEDESGEFAHTILVMDNFPTVIEVINRLYS